MPIRPLHELISNIRDSDIRAVAVLPIVKNTKPEKVLLSCKSYSTGFKKYVFTHLFGYEQITVPISDPLAPEEISLLKAIIAMTSFIFEYQQSVPPFSVFERYFPLDWLDQRELSKIDKNWMINFQNTFYSNDHRPISGTRAKRITLIKSQRLEGESWYETLQRLISNELEPYISPDHLKSLSLLNPIIPHRLSGSFIQKTLVIILPLTETIPLVPLTELIHFTDLQETACISWIPTSNARLLEQKDREFADDQIFSELLK